MIDIDIYIYIDIASRIPAVSFAEVRVEREGRFIRRLADHNLAIVAGPGQWLVGPLSITPIDSEHILGPRG